MVITKSIWQKLYCFSKVLKLLKESLLKFDNIKKIFANVLRKGFIANKGQKFSSGKQIKIMQRFIISGILFPKK